MTEPVHVEGAGGGPSDAPDPARARRSMLRRLTGNGVTMAAAIVLAAFVVTAVVGPWVVPIDPDVQDLASRLESPSWEHWFGTDDLGRDTFSRTVVAAGISLRAAVTAIAVALVLGLPLGVAAGYLRGWFGRISAAVSELLMSFPPIVLAISVIAILGPGLTNAMIAIGLIFAPRLYRIARSAAHAVSTETFIESAQASGCSSSSIIVRHIVPNVFSPIVVYVSFAMGTALLIEASLSFLGLGVQPPEASWGSMLGRAFRNIYANPIGVIFPGIAISLTVLSFNILGDRLRDVVATRRSVEL